jgi:hypothetical protein
VNVVKNLRFTLLSLCNLKVTNDDVTFLEPQIIYSEEEDEIETVNFCQINSDPDMTCQIKPDPDRTRRKIERLFQTLKPYNIPRELINSDGQG